ncbi:MAG TPA: hypothetical protein VEY30_11390 [Myxococcaceae bacterium]|nr:hypothetical protein [Myxococcaceae bacterium]
MAGSERLSGRVKALSQAAVEKLLENPDRAKALATAMGNLQRRKQALDRRQTEWLRSLQFAPKEDYKAVGKKLAGLKRRLRDLDEKLAKVE